MADVTANATQLVFGNSTELAEITDSVNVLKAQEVEFYDRSEVDALLADKANDVPKDATEMPMSPDDPTSVAEVIDSISLQLNGLADALAAI